MQAQSEKTNELLNRPHKQSKQKYLRTLTNRFQIQIDIFNQSYSPLLKLKFDLNPDERREGAVQFAGGDWMRELVDDAAIKEDIDGLIQFQRRSISGDPALVRHEKARAQMWELALRGLWPKAIEEDATPSS